ncbi:MAG: hypothetical protein AAF962_02355 [Actinomycetota bacterium]
MNTRSLARLRFGRRRLLVAMVAVGALLILLVPSDASGSGRWSELERWDPDTPSPTGQSVAVECNAPDDAGAEVWDEAKAWLKINDRNGSSRLTFIVRNARPDTLYTVWLRLAGVDSSGDAYGGSPLVGIPVTPLVASDELPEQVAITLPNPGSDDVPNGFRTNSRGRGRVVISVDFPISSGAYPFQRFPDFADHADDVALTNQGNVDRLGGGKAAVRPVAITDGSQAPATFLIASHCVDDVAHGLLPGPHENWFTFAID